MLNCHVEYAKSQNRRKAATLAHLSNLDWECIFHFRLCGPSIYDNWAAYMESRMSNSVAPEPPFSNLARQANKLVDQMHKGYFSFSPIDTWTPSVNLYETAKVYLVCVDLAGVEKDKIDVEVIDSRLRLRGARPVPTCDDANPSGQPQRVRIHLMEIDHGSFSREVDLPEDINREGISATYRNGMLWIEIPRA